MPKTQFFFFVANHDKSRDARNRGLASRARTWPVPWVSAARGGGAAALSLHGNRLGDAGVAALAGLARAPALRRCRLLLHVNAIGAQAARTRRFCAALQLTSQPGKKYEKFGKGANGMLFTSVKIIVNFCAVEIFNRTHKFGIFYLAIQSMVT